MFGVSSIFGEGLAPVKFDAQHQGKHHKFGKGYRNEIGYINKKGQVIVQPKYDLARPFENGLAEVSCGRVYAYIDINGTEYWDYDPSLDNVEPEEYESDDDFYYYPR